MWKAWPRVESFPSRPTKPFAKSCACVTVQSELPSPCTMTSPPRRIRVTSVRSSQPPIATGQTVAYVSDGRTITIGKSRSRQSAVSRSSQAILFREYSQTGFLSGVDSVARCGIGF